MEDNGFDVSMELKNGYKFLVDFHQKGVEPLLLDEPPPLGEGHGPSPTRLLAAAVGNCLSTSLMFCLGKAHVDVQNMRTSVRSTKARNEKGRLRIARIDVRLEIEVAEEDIPRMSRCLELFEDYCTVTGSVRAGIEVNVEAVPIGVRATAQTAAAS